MSSAAWSTDFEIDPLPKTAVRVGFETDPRSYGKAAIRIHCTIAAVLAAYAFYPKHGFSGAVVAGIAGCLGGLLGVLLTFLFIFTVGMVLTKVVDVVFESMEKYAANALFSTEGLRERDALEHYQNGMRLDSENRCSDAIREYEIAVELLPDFPQAVHNLAFDRGAVGDFQQEISGYLDAIKLKPDYALAITNLITTYKDHGQAEDAYQWEERLAQLKRS